MVGSFLIERPEEDVPFFVGYAVDDEPIGFRERAGNRECLFGRQHEQVRLIRLLPRDHAPRIPIERSNTADFRPDRHLASTGKRSRQGPTECRFRTIDRQHRN